MAGTITTVAIIAIGALFITLLLPIWFDAEFPAGNGLTFVERAICVIVTNGGGNYTCIEPYDQVYFNST